MNKKTLRVLEYDKILEKLWENCVSEEAKWRVEEMQPSIDSREISQWQAETSEAQALIIKAGTFHIGPIKNLKMYLKIAAIGSMLQPKQLLDLGDTLRTARILKTHIERHQNEDFLMPMMTGYTGQMQVFKNIEQEIERCIVSETEISSQASQKLAQIRKAIESKNTQIRNRLDKIVTSDRMQKYLQDSLVTIRQDRFVIPIKAEHKTHIKGLVHDQSSSGATFYIEPIEIVELNNELKELHLDEQKEIERILRAITAMVGQVQEAISLTYDALVHLDFVMAKGRLSVDMNAIEPLVSKDKTMKIKRGKHPLIPKEVVVPTQFHMGQTFTSLLITGPNTGGKTVTLKTVGLFALMFQSGLHLPAEHGTVMPVFEKIYADIGDEQSIEQSLSTFSSHMTNIVDILQHVDSETLVLFDELGAGTDPTEGAALAMAILRFVKAVGALCVSTTHYSELKHFALTNDGFENACVEFDIKTLSPTYHLLIGVPGKSNAFEISRKLGLDEHIIESALRFIDTDSIALEDVLQSIEANRRQAEADRDQAIQVKLDAEKLKDRLARAEQKVNDQRDRVLREAKLEAKKILKEAKETVDVMVKELKDMQQGALDHKRIEQMRRDLNDSVKDMHTGEALAVTVEGIVPKNLRLGQDIFVTTIGQAGTIVELPNAKGEVQVQCGIMKMSVLLKDLRITSKKEVKQKKSRFTPATGNTGGQTHRAETRLAVSSEIDVRGTDLDEAMMRVDRYLDQVSQSSLEQVVIIHGVGTGVLKKGLTDFLRHHHHVKTHRPGAYGEGGAGVTIVVVK